MNDDITISEYEITSTYTKLKKDAEANGYHLNPDVEMTQELVKGIIINDKRYGYWNCPCRLATGNNTDDLDIICPCDYRDADVMEFGTCY
jgi:ferredoxin-thioredoxin reductase catalytic subunit